MENINIENVNIENLSDVLSKNQKLRLDSILLLIDSDKTNDEKKKLLKRRSKKDLQKVIDFLDNMRKTFTVFSLNRERRVFTLEEFESRNKDYIDKNNLIRIYLREQPKLPTIEKEPLWFEALLQCFVLEYLPLYWASGDKVDTNFYKKFTVKELKEILTREIENPISIWDDIEYAKRRSVSIPNLIRLYNLENPNTPWGKNSSATSFREIQLALDIQTPLERDIDGVDKDVIIYYMITTGNREEEINSIRSSIIYDRLGLVRSPQTIQELFRLDTQSFNANKNFIRRELTQRWREIPTTYGDDENFKLGISKKIKYCYIANNIRDKKPKDIVHSSHINDLLLTLKFIEKEFN